MAPRVSVMRAQGAAVPEQGQLVQVRERRWVVGDVSVGPAPDPTAPGEGAHLVTLRSIEDDAEPDEALDVIWELELGGHLSNRRPPGCDR